MCVPSVSRPLGVVVERIKFTTERVAAIKAPASGEIFVGDVEVPQLLLRVRSSGAKTWMMRYRSGGGGRAAASRKLTLGDAMKVGVADARTAAKTQIGVVAQGRDPAAEKRAAARRQEARLDRAIPAYVASLRKRQLVKAADIETLLSRELISRFGAAHGVSELTRRDFAALFDAVEASGRAGTARDLKSRCSTFLNWLVAEGVISANVLAGMRRPRATRAEALEEGEGKGRSLNEEEIRQLWVALGCIEQPMLAAYVKFLLLTGCRRTEAAALRRSWLREVDGRQFCVIPAERTKSGRDHIVPAPPILAALIGQLPKMDEDPDLVFPGRGGKQMSGWTQRLRPLRDELATRGFHGVLRLHDLRKTVRSWLPVLGADDGLAGRMLNHRPKDTLVRIYDKNERLAERYELAQRWSERVIEIVTSETAHAALDGRKIVQLIRRQ